MYKIILLIVMPLVIPSFAQAEMLYGAASRIQERAAIIQVNRAAQFGKAAERTREHAAALRDSGASVRAEMWDKISEQLEQRRNQQFTNGVYNFAASDQNRALANSLGSTSSQPIVTAAGIKAVNQAAVFAPERHLPERAPTAGVISTSELMQAKGFGLPAAK